MWKKELLKCLFRYVNQLGLTALSSLRLRADRGFVQENDSGSAKLLIRRARGRVEKKKDLQSYLPLYKAVLESDWNVARNFLDEDGEALTAKISIASETALHIAVGKGKDVEFAHNLIRKMSPEDLTLTDQNGETTLSIAAAVGNFKAAQLLVNKNPDLPNISGRFGFPIHKAAEYGQETMLRFLLDVTSSDLEMESSPFAEESGAKLLIDIITAEFFGIALYLVKLYPDMATCEVQGVGSPLNVLAKKSTSFPSGGVIHWNHYLYKFAKISKQMRKQHDALELVKILCMEILEMDDAKAFSLFQQPILIAARHLIIRYVARPHENNILHLAGKLPSSDRLNIFSGAALQVQRELQWFEEVKKLVQEAHKEAINKDGKTPLMVFQESHQQLMKDGEK